MPRHIVESDITTASMSFVVDEDNMVSNSATKVPTQQSVKAYVDASAGGGSGGGAAQTTNIATANADNTANVQSGAAVFVTNPVTINRLSCIVKVFEASQTVELGVWDSNKANLVSATTVPTAAGIQTVTIADTTIGPGLVYFGLVNQTGGATMTFAWETGESDPIQNFITGGVTSLEATVSGGSGTGRTYWIGAHKV